MHQLISKPHLKCSDLKRVSNVKSKWEESCFFVLPSLIYDKVVIVLIVPFFFFILFLSVLTHHRTHYRASPHLFLQGPSAAVWSPERKLIGYRIQVFSTGDWQAGRVGPEHSRNLSGPAAVERGEQTRRTDNSAAVLVLLYHATDCFFPHHNLHNVTCVEPHRRSMVAWQLHRAPPPSFLYIHCPRGGGKERWRACWYFFFHLCSGSLWSTWSSVMSAIWGSSCHGGGHGEAKAAWLLLLWQSIHLGRPPCPVPRHTLARECKDGAQHRE